MQTGFLHKELAIFTESQYALKVWHLLSKLQHTYAKVLTLLFAYICYYIIMALCKQNIA